jgi:serine/threonine protein kinase
VETREEFRMAALLRDMDMPPPGRGKLIDVRPLREELEEIQDPVVPPGLIDFIESLIVVDMEKRPIAHDALKHPYLDISSESRNGVSVVAN